jgi:Holliday junction resolvase RusA-like endonuclease
MKQSFFIIGPMPSLNDWVGNRTRWHYRAVKAEWSGTIRYRIKHAKLKPMACAFVSFAWHEKNRKRDPDNIMSAQKFILDALVEAKILPDDGWDEVLGLTHTFSVEPANPGVLVTLREEAG